MISSYDRVLNMSDNYKIDVYEDCDRKELYLIKLRKWNGYDYDSIEFRTYGNKDEAIGIAQKLADLLDSSKIRTVCRPSIHIE